MQLPLFLVLLRILKVILSLKWLLVGAIQLVLKSIGFFDEFTVLLVEVLLAFGVVERLRI
jgi:hypothetical protein